MLLWGGFFFFGGGDYNEVNLHAFKYRRPLLQDFYAITKGGITRFDCVCVQSHTHTHTSEGALPLMLAAYLFDSMDHFSLKSARFVISSRFITACRRSITII